MCPDQNNSCNLILCALPRAERERIKSKMEFFELTPRKILYDPDKPIGDVYFPEVGVVSLVARMKDGSVMEIATVGNEGMIGLPIFLGAISSPLQAFAQVPGKAWRLKTAEFKKALANGTGLRDLLSRYTQALFVQMSQSVACNRMHSVEQRCARWLLLTSDRVNGERFKLTQEFLAQMLGVRRAGVNVVLNKFRQKGMVDYSQGEMQITKRSQLEHASCECYEIVRDEYRKLVGKS